MALPKYLICIIVLLVKLRVSQCSATDTGGQMILWGGGVPGAQQGIDQHPDPYPLDRCLERSPSIMTTGNVSYVVKCALQSKMTPS